MSVKDYKIALSEIMRRSVGGQEDFYRVTGKFKCCLTSALSQAETCISIGTGAGELDLYAIRMFMPNLKEFHGVDLNKELAVDLDYNLRELQREMPNLEVSTYQADAATWQGIGKKVDVILAFGVLYNFRDTEAVLKKFDSWINPGGVQWYIYNDSDWLGSRMASSFKIDRGNLLDVDVPETMLSLGHKEVMRTKRRIAVCLRSPNKLFLQMILMRQPTDEEFERFVGFVNENYARNDFLCYFHNYHDVYVRNY